MTEAGIIKRTYQADILHNIILTEQTGDASDTYIISPVFHGRKDTADLQCHHLNSEKGFTTEKFYFPLSISEILDQEDNDPAFSLFNQCLDRPLARQMIDARLDYLDCYVAIQRRPDLEKFIKKPLLLLIIAQYWVRFEKLKVTYINDLSSWLPSVLRLDNVTLTRGKIRCLARLDYTNRKLVISTTRLILQRFQQLYRRFPTEGMIDPAAVQELSRLIKACPELSHARWLHLNDFPRAKWKETLNLYEDTLLLLTLNGYPDPERQLITQPRTMDEVLNLHNRAHFEWESPLADPNTPLTTWSIEDGEYFRVIRVLGDLNAVEEELQNCATIFFSRCVDGDSVLVRYERGDVVALLELKFYESTPPIIGQFYGPENILPDETAWLDLKEWIQTSEYGPLAQYSNQLVRDCKSKMAKLRSDID